MATRTAKPPTHGKISLSISKHAPPLKKEHARAHLSMMTDSASEIRDYSFGDSGSRQSSQGSLTSSGSSGADYTTGSCDSIGDADSGGPGGI